MNKTVNQIRNDDSVINEALGFNLPAVRDERVRGPYVV